MIFAETDRLRLRSYEERDVPRLVQYLSNWNVVKWMGMIPMPYTPLHAREWLKKMTDLERAGTPEFLLFTNKETDALYGAIGIHPIHSVKGKDGDYEIGYWLGEPFWRQGLTTEALQAALAWAIKQPWVRRLCATTDCENKPSQRVLEKLNFISQGNRPRTEGIGNSEISLWYYPEKNNS